jgi:hypothetical protein
MATAKLICIEGYWNEPHKPRLEERCLVMPSGLTDSMRDVVLRELINRDNVFYIFDAEDSVMGEHKAFTVTFVNPIYEVEVPAVC